jgi:hypothetical protein
LILCVAYVLSVGASAQTGRPTIPDLVRQQAPQPVWQGRIAEQMPKDLEELAPLADLVIKGKVASARAYLSKDERDLYTDYVIHPSQVFLQARVHDSPQPGVVAAIVVRKWGGQTVIEGVQVTAEDSNVRAFIVGEELLLCLTYDQSTGKYVIAGGTGAFSVRGDVIYPFMQHPKTESLTAMKVEEFAAEIRRLRPSPDRLRR